MVYNLRKKGYSWFTNKDQDNREQANLVASNSLKDTICSMMGPASSSSVTKWAVAPINFTPALNACQCNITN